MPDIDSDKAPQGNRLSCPTFPRSPGQDDRVEQPWIIPLPGFLLLALLTLPPFLYAVYLSFVKIDISVPNNPIHFVWFSNYAAVLGSANGLHALMVTLIVSFGSTAAAICLGLFVAYLIHFFAGRLDGFVTILVSIALFIF